MLNPATVNKLAKLFVEKTAAYLEGQKYAVEGCLSNIYLRYYTMAKYMEDCLEFEDECVIEDLVKNVTIVDSEDFIDCDEREPDVDFNLTTVSCELTTDGGSIFPNGQQVYVTLTPSAIYHSAYLFSSIFSTCSSEVYTNFFTNGAYRVSSLTPSGASDDYKAYAHTYGILNIPFKSYPSGYLSTLRLWSTNSFGTSPSFVDYDISPARVTDTTWTACPTCSPINAAHLVFGASSTNYVNALTTLLNNISKTLFTGSYIFPTVTLQNSSITISTLIKHAPTTYHMGINPDSFRFTYSLSGSGLDVTGPGVITRGANANVVSTLGKMADLGNANLFSNIISLGSCTRQVMLYSNDLGPMNTTPTTNFNQIVLTNPAHPVTLSIEYDNTPCTYDYINAVVDPSLPEYLYVWKDTSGDEVTTTKTVLATDSGTYTFIISDTLRGCNYEYEYSYGG